MILGNTKFFCQKVDCLSENSNSLNSRILIQHILKNELNSGGPDGLPLNHFYSQRPPHRLLSNRLIASLLLHNIQIALARLFSRP